MIDRYIPGNCLIVEGEQIYYVEFNPIGKTYERREISAEDLAIQYRKLDKMYAEDCQFEKSQADMWKNKYEQFKAGVETAIKIMELMRNE